jgi:dATP/dGTP diphosphohydrolase
MSKEGVKFDTDKVPMELLSHEALTQIAKVLGYGASKYGRYNYKAGMKWSRIIGAAYRHLGAFNSGEDLDPETQLSHVAHLGCCVIMLLDYIKYHPELDDRYKQKVLDSIAKET